MQNLRPTRMRRTHTLRNLVRETTLSMNDVVYPIFVVEGENIETEIPSMKGQYHYSIDRLEAALPAFKALGIQALLLFGLPSKKDEAASTAYDYEGIVQKAIRTIKAFDSELFVISDICLCQYKSDGHCCFFNEDGNIQREKTLETLSKIALSHAKAGVDMVAPSDMMDGRIESLRLDLNNDGYEHLPIMAYSAKYASAFYGPFREAAHSAPAFGDRRAYQMDPANKKEAQLEMQLDLAEGADVLMVKPAMPYLDIIKTASETMVVPIAAYQVSGEYAMLKNAAEAGLMDERAVYESLIGIKRSGATLIMTYFAKDLKRLIEKYQ
ncbi:MAG: porphobilinogen synthase [Vallitaleaceae bacterium]|nr:porphobilinogen synthase [Vallitaleaceae bacterium]